jgi:hypothetical protein
MDLDEQSSVWKIELCTWHRMLAVGRRAPVDSVPAMFGLDSVVLECRVRLVARLVPLVNSPPDSLQHAALLMLIALPSP